MYTAQWFLSCITYDVIQNIACERMHSMPFAKVGHNDQLTEYLWWKLQSTLITNVCFS